MQGLTCLEAYDSYSMCCRLSPPCRASRPLRPCYQGKPWRTVPTSCFFSVAASHARRSAEGLIRPEVRLDRQNAAVRIKQLRCFTCHLVATESTRADTYAGFSRYVFYSFWLYKFSAAAQQQRRRHQSYVLSYLSSIPYSVDASADWQQNVCRDE